MYCTPPVYKLPSNPGGIPVDILEFQWKSWHSRGNPGIPVEFRGNPMEFRGNPMEFRGNPMEFREN